MYMYVCTYTRKRVYTYVRWPILISINIFVCMFIRTALYVGYITYIHKYLYVDTYIVFAYIYVLGLRISMYMRIYK